MFTPLNLPQVHLKITTSPTNAKERYVFDEFRKKKCLLTPEEWVRQHYLHFLVNEKGFPKGLIASEYSIKVNNLKRRCDGVAFDQSGKPILLIECKAPTVKLSEKTLHQIAQYNFKMRVNWLVLTNGLNTVVCFINTDEKKIQYLEDIPTFNELLN